MHTAKIIIDGDYLDFYIDDVFIHTFCKINEATLKEYENLIKNNTCGPAMRTALRITTIKS